MDLLDKMNDALDYVEENLKGEIDLEEAARRACCSYFNFQRMFSFIADVSLADYIRKRRLTMAAMDLLGTDVKIIDVALQYGYESPVSFARAFAAVHDVNPSEIRKRGVKMKAYPRITFEISIKGVKAMNYRIEDKGQFRLVGYKERIGMDNGENFRRVPEFWTEIMQSGQCDKMKTYNDNDKLVCLGVCANEDNIGFDYYIATGSDKKIPADMSELVVPAATYVIFTCVGQLPESQQNVWKRIFTEWFPASNYDIGDGPQMEWYSDGDSSADDYVSEIWIPVRKKK
jgi:AraC family transcriptional regulator